MSLLTRTIRRSVWEWRSYLSEAVPCRAEERLTVLMTTFSPVRARRVGHQVRHLLNCSFVDRVVVSNHNPALALESLVPVDPRVTIVNQSAPRGCGHRWLVAARFAPEYLIAIDDDILLYPRQVARLFEWVVEEPLVPHGIAGMRARATGDFEFAERQDARVDFLCEVYGLTGLHLRRYCQFRRDAEGLDGVGSMMDGAADFVALSQMGEGQPHIHDLGSIRRCETFAAPGIAVHKDGTFATAFHRVAGAVQEYRAHRQHTDMLETTADPQPHDEPAALTVSRLVRP